MDRKIDVVIDKSTWPVPGPAFPNKFHTARRTVTVNIPGVLLTIGYLTTPASVVGVSLSEYWAWVRYLHAISSRDDLTLSDDFASLDAHQKTILSDDFGMGLPIYWLLDKLDIQSVCDGRYFIDFVAASIGATTKKISKRGPRKSPDFVALDEQGRFHVIECKGTQSGTEYRSKQFGNVGLGRGIGATGAIAQKNTISFPRAKSGQKLACGLCLETYQSASKSSLKIIDPDEEEQFTVTGSSIVYARDATIRSTLAKTLRLSGFAASSDFVTAPRGATPSSQATTGFREELRRSTVVKKRERVRSELQDKIGRTVDIIHGEELRGREATIDLPKPVIVGSKEVRQIVVRQGFNARILTDISERGLIEEPLEDLSADIAPDRIKVMAEEQAAQLKIGNLFASEIELL